MPLTKEKGVASIHLKIKPYTCGKCEKSFSQKIHLITRDNFVHKKLKPFKCEEFEKSFSRKRNLIGKKAKKMDIPLPPSASMPQKTEYSPSQVTSPHSDDDDAYMNKMSKDSSPLYSNSSKKVLSKKKVSSMLKSMKMTTITNLGTKGKSKNSLSTESLSKEYDNDEHENSVSTQDEEDLSRSSFTRFFITVVEFNLLTDVVKHYIRLVNCPMKIVSI